MSYDQWKTSSPDEYEECSCGSGCERYRVYSNSQTPWRLDMWVCEECEDERIERALEGN